MNRNYRTGLTSLSEAKEDLGLYHIVFDAITEFKKHVYLKAAQLFESGIFWHLYKNAYFPKDFNSKPQEIGPQVLTLTHLKAGFVIIIALLSLSIVAFIYECTPLLSRKLFKLCLSCYIVVKFTKMNKML
jgi:hypothetical protein